MNTIEFNRAHMSRFENDKARLTLYETQHQLQIVDRAANPC